MTELTFIRHGETDFNRELRFQGQVDVPLNALGRAQAARLAERLRHAPKPDALISSDLLRVRQTAAPLAAAWGLEPTLEAGFREQGFGIFEGLDAPTIRARHPELWRGWIEHRGDFALPGGESLVQLHARVMAAVARWAERHVGARLVVFTHGGVLDMLWRQARGLPIAGLRQCDIPNTGINVLRWAEGRLDIERWADAAHLQGLAPGVAAPAGER